MGPKIFGNPRRQLFYLLVAQNLILITTGKYNTSLIHNKKNKTIDEDAFPEYWKDFRDFTHISHAFDSFWRKYMYCQEYDYREGCFQYRVATGHNWHFKTYMSSMDNNITNLDHEQNPLKCHWSELWSSVVAGKAMYVSSIKSYNELTETTIKLKVNGEYTTQTIDYRDYWNDTKIGTGTFVCGDAMNFTFPRNLLGTMIYNEDAYIGYWYNTSTHIVEEQDYGDYGEQEYGYVAESTESSTKTTPTTTEPSFQKILNMTGKLRPWWIAKGVMNIPKPWGNKCPNSFLGKVNITGTYNLLCISEFPNIPYLGTIQPVHLNGTEITDLPYVKSKWNITWWQDTLKLGVHTWEIPLTLTDILVQPFQAPRKDHVDTDTHGNCNHPTHTCYRSLANTTIVSNTTSVNVTQIWICLKMGVQAKHSMTLNLNHTGLYRYAYYPRRSRLHCNKGNIVVWHFSMRNLTTAPVIWLDKGDNLINITDQAPWIPQEGGEKKIQVHNITQYSLIYNGTVYYDHELTLPTYLEGMVGRVGSCQHNSSLLPPPPPTHICAENQINDTYPVPQDIEYNIGNYSKKASEYGTYNNPRTKHNNLTNIILNITYTRPTFLEDVKVMYWDDRVSPSDEQDTKWYREVFLPIQNWNDSIRPEGLSRFAHFDTTPHTHVRYSGISRTDSLETFRTLNSEWNRAIELQHEGLPYYFAFWLINPRYDEWEEMTWIKHTPKDQALQQMYAWDTVKYLPYDHELFRKYYKPEDGKLIYRGQITGTTNISLYTAHFPIGYLNSPDGIPVVRKAPMAMPDLKVPARIILRPKVRKVTLKIDLTVLEPPMGYCDDRKMFTQIQYDSPLSFGRKPLQLLAAAIIAGGILGGILGGGVAAAELVPIKAELSHIQMLNKKTSEAIAAISNSLDTVNILQQQMRAEMALMEKTQEDRLQWMKEMFESEHSKLMCMQYQMANRKIERELDILFTTGKGRRTPEFITIQDPQCASTCSSSLCEFHLYQIFTTNAYAGYHTKLIPQKIERKDAPFTNSYWNWLAPAENFLYMTVNDNPLYIPMDDTYKLDDNTYVYPHVPEAKLEETRLTVTTMPDTILDLGQWTFLTCTNKPAIGTCRNLNESTYNDTITSFNITEGCWIVHNCSIFTIFNKTYYTQISVPRFNMFASPSDVLRTLEEKHWDDFARQVQKIQDIADHNQEQLKSIHQKMERTELHLMQSQAEVHNLVGLLRTNTYVHKDWNKELKKCSAWDYIARLFKLDLTCTPLYGWWQWLKELTYWIVIGIAGIIVLRIVFFFVSRRKYGKLREKLEQKTV